jgi:hypothetical protein|uniref:Uncharacterized protein n=1 Tax=Thermofilum pendens TaxID=2269 RepID=A0A7C3SLR9_THEPE
MMHSKAVEYACGDLYIRLREEDKAYCIEYPEQLEEYCLYAVLALEKHCIDKEELARRFGGADGLAEEIISRCPELKRRASLPALAGSLRRHGWSVYEGEYLVEAIFSRGMLAVEVHIKPISSAFSELRVRVRAYPGSLHEALDLRRLLLSAGLRVESLLPVVAASSPEERVFNCAVPRALTELVERVERMLKRY